ncbi:MAG: NADH:flavin oxidoreductase [Deltaproteobacteria bacterium]|nr:NADH:flavin oxidoreductase [Deltaproteobacteria bacterium]
MPPPRDKRLARVLPVPRWPSSEEAAALRWFAPGSLGPLATSGRTWVPAMVPWRASPDGFVTERVIDWYRRFAAGRPAVLVIEATGIRDVPSGPLLRIGHERFVPGLRDLARAVHEASDGQTRLLIQLIDFLAIRRRPTAEKFFGRYLEIDDPLRGRLAAHLGDDGLGRAPEGVVRERLIGLSEEDYEQVLTARDLESYRRGYRERVTDVHLPAIRDLPEVLPPLFAAAAVRAQAAGFDGVELHYAHAYTMASFLSARNDREDGYGGSLANRMRLPLEVFAAVRAAVGKEFPVGCRYLGDEVIEGGSRLDDAIYFAERFAAAGMDFLSISKGGKFEDAKAPKVGQSIYPYTGPSGQECMPTVRIDARGPFGRNVNLARAIRRAVRSAGFETPVVAAGGICSPYQAEEILAAGDADFVAAARQTLADPDWFLKTRRGRGDEVRRCLYTNYCEALDQAHKEVTCQRWDRTFPEGEGEVPRSADGKRRLEAPPWRDTTR